MPIGSMIGWWFCRTSRKTLTACQTELVEVVLEFKKQEVGFDRLNLTRFLEMLILRISLVISFSADHLYSAIMHLVGQYQPFTDATFAKQAPLTTFDH
jgi:hypothetical protein